MSSTKVLKGFTCLFYVERILSGGPLEILRYMEVGLLFVPPKAAFKNKSMYSLTLTAGIVTKYQNAGSRGWCARGPRIETRGSHHIIAHPISRQIGFLAQGLGL